MEQEIVKRSANLRLHTILYNSLFITYIVRFHRAKIWLLHNNIMVDFYERKIWREGFKMAAYIEGHVRIRITMAYIVLRLEPLRFCRDDCSLCESGLMNWVSAGSSRAASLPSRAILSCECMRLTNSLFDSHLELLYLLFIQLCVQMSVRFVA